VKSEGQGALQDIYQMSLFHSVCKWQKSVKTFKDIVTSLKQAMQMVRSGTPGPVFVKLPADVSVPVTTSSQQVLVPNHVITVPPEVTVPDGIQTNARVNADKPGMAASG
jgi:thiamine pyrophosphate-dependent acetolactate synthase large subunit-like protein